MKRSPRLRRAPRPAIAALAFAFASAGCSNLVGLTGYSTKADGGAVGDDAAPRTDAPQSDAGAGATADATPEAGCSDEGGSCYACVPTTNPQFLNACTAAVCVPFDDVGRLTKILPDGALPPLPSLPDAGSD